jgi:translation initiation factor eIF-2B subunit delta
MGNAIKYLKMCISKVQYIIHYAPYTILIKMCISKISPDCTEADAKQDLCRKIDTFIQERITFADDVIVDHALSKIQDGDTVLTYARSHVVEKLLLTAHKKGKKFRLIIADSRPLMEGMELRRRLAKQGLNCTYILLNGISYIMKEVTKVFMGAASLYGNGAVLSRVGTAVVAMTAKAYNVPVMICCETYKFCERVQLDSICYNELGDPDQLIAVGQGAAMQV